MPAPRKVDVNQPEIVLALERVGAYVVDIHIVPNAFDILVAFRGKLFCGEIKNPEYAPKRSGLAKMLTAGEKECKERLERAGVKYYIWLTIDNALKDIGAIE